MNYDDAAGGTFWNVFLYLLAAIITGGSTWFATWWKMRQGSPAKAAAKTEAEQRAEFYATLLDEVQGLRAQNLELLKKVSHLESEVETLKGRLIYYEQNPANTHARELFAAVMDSLAEPAWLRDVGGNHWYLNAAYCARFGIPRRTWWQPINIYGRYDADDAIRYTANDLRVIETNAQGEFVERVRAQILDPDCDEFLSVRIRKTPLSVNGRPFIFGKLVETLETPEAE